MSFVVKVKKYDGTLLNNPVFDTEEEAQAWMNDAIAAHSFGEPERTMPESGLTADEISRATSSQIIHDDESGKDVTWYTVPADYSYSIEDNTDIESIAPDVGMIQKGTLLLGFITNRNRTKTGLTTQQVQQMTQTYGTIELAILSGSLTTVRYVISGMTPDGAVLTQDDKDAILGFIDKLLAN